MEQKHIGKYDATRDDRTNMSRREHLLLAVVLLIVAVGAVTSWHLGARKRQAASVPAGNDIAHFDRLNAQLASLDHPNRVFTITIDDGKQVAGPTVMHVKLNDVVRINIKAGGKDEVEAGLDAYGLFTESAPEDNVPGGFSFVADRSGTFTYYTVKEAEVNGHERADGTASRARGAKADLGTLIVEP